MFRFFANHRRAEGGFTLIELVVVLAILGIIIALAVPRYLGARKYGYASEARNTLQEVKTLEWAYFQQHNSFVAFGSVSDGATAAPIGFASPASTKFAYNAVTAGSAASIVIGAVGVGAPGDPWLGITMALTLSNDGNSSLVESF